MINEAELKEMNRDDALKLYVPKWSQCIINGNKITPEQADEIIRRTDCYFSYPSSNDHNFDEKFKEISQGIFDLPFSFDIDDENELKKRYLIYQKLEEKIKKSWGYIDLLYLSNDFIASSFVEGANGWCHPDGTIGYCYNIGKWPEIEFVESDLQKITQEFPFLRLECTLCLREYCNEDDNESIVTMIAEKGNIKFYEPVPYDKLEKVQKDYEIESDNWVSHCFTIEHIKEWFDKIDLDKLKGEE